MKVKPTILHIDVNSYFASLMQQENPYLRSRPVGIIKDHGRTCLIAASKEAKTRGIKTGMSRGEAQKLCPNLICLPARFDFYLDATHQLNHIFSQVAPHYYIYSLDEAFIDISDCRQYLYSHPLTLAHQLQERIKSKLGEWVTCNVGISHNRLLAKLASETAPQGTIKIIDESNLDVELATVDMADVCGIGYRLTEKLRRWGVNHPYQLRFFDPLDLTTLVGPFWAQELQKIAYGRETHLLSLIDRSVTHMKSVGRSITGYRLFDDEFQIKNIIRNLIEEITHKARQMRLAGRQVWIGLWGHRQFWQAHQTLTEFIQYSQPMFNIIYHQLYQTWSRNFPIITFAVRLGLLQSQFNQPPSLFDDQQQHQQRIITQAVDQINDRYGLFTIRPASLLNHSLIRPEVTGFLGDRQYYGL